MNNRINLKYQSFSHLEKVYLKECIDLQKEVLILETILLNNTPYTVHKLNKLNEHLDDLCEKSFKKYFNEVFEKYFTKKEKIFYQRIKFLELKSEMLKVKICSESRFTMKTLKNKIKDMK